MRQHAVSCLCAGLTVILVAGCTVLGVPSQSPLDAFAAHLDERAPALMDRYGVPGVSIAVVRDGELVWVNAYGYADPREGRAMTPETLLRVQSITKSATAWGVMKLVEQGAIGLDDPITARVTTWEFPETDYDWDEVTVRRLLSHSAGLPAGGYSAPPPAEGMPPLHWALSGGAGAPAARPIDPPGSLFRYSNPGYVLLELLIEEVTGREFAGYMEGDVLRPLGMDQATFTWTDDVRAALATSHRATGDPVPLYRPHADGPQAPSAHGTLYATAGDIGRLVAAGMEGPGGEPAGRRVLAVQSVNEMHTPVVETTGFYSLGAEGSGLGHLVETLGGGERALTHGGQGAGSYSWYHSVPQTGDGIVILTNSERSLQFIADILGDWTAWRGLSPVGLTHAVRWARAFVGALGLLALGLAAWLVSAVALGRRPFAPLASRARLGRTLLGGFGLLILGLWWGLGYGVVRHFLPVFSGWLGIVLSAAFGMVVLTALFPRQPPSPSGARGGRGH